MAPARISQRKPSAGLILPAVLATLLVVMLFGAAMTRALVAHRRQVRLGEDQQQSFWLAESAIQRALWALSKSPDYRGETWRVPAEVLGAGKAGAVVIRVESAAAPQPGRLIRVEAQYPEHPIHRILHERKLFVPSRNP